MNDSNKIHLADNVNKFFTLFLDVKGFAKARQIR
jgi:hypothetical protein